MTHDDNDQPQGGGTTVHDQNQHDADPVVLTVRLRGRLLPFATVLLVGGLFPFLGGSADAGSRTVVLAAESSSASAASAAAVGDAAAAVDEARAGLVEAAAFTPAPPATETVPTDAAIDAAMGGGLFVFPAISMTPSTVPGLALTPAVSGENVMASGFIRPVPGPESSGFGPRIHPVLGRAMFHTGIDLMSTCGTPIHAAADGTVVYARVSASWGLRTIIAHSSSLKTAYGHQSQFFVKEGDVVKRGQVIGLVGTTGWSTGCHLHFDVIIDNRYVDPAPYLGLAGGHGGSAPYAATPGFVVGGSTTPRPVVVAVPDGDVEVVDASPESGTRPAPTVAVTVATVPSSTLTGTPTTSRPSPSSSSTSTASPTTVMTTTPPVTTTTSVPSATASTPTTATTIPTTMAPPTTIPATTAPATTTPPTTTPPTTTPATPATPVPVGSTAAPVETMGTTSPATSPLTATATVPGEMMPSGSGTSAASAEQPTPFGTSTGPVLPSDAQSATAAEGSPRA